MNGVRKAKGNHPNKTLPTTHPGYARAYLQSLVMDSVVALEGRYSLTDATFDCDTIERRIAAEGLGFAVTALPTLIAGLLDMLEGRDASFPQFRLKRGTEYPVFLHRLFDLAVSAELPIRAKAFDCLYSISVAFKKLRGEYKASTLLKQFNDFKAVDVELDSLDFFTGPVYDILCRARNYIKSVFADFSFEGMSPRPGPGATNVATKKHERYLPRVVYKQIDDIMPIEDWWSPHPWDACLRSREFLSLRQYTVESPCARFKFVPKTAGKARGICIEENEMQVMQQALRSSLYGWIESKFPTQIALRDQSVNARLALESSTSRINATIDMSEASDRVSRELVSWLFQDHQELHDMLMALSTRWILPPLELGDEAPDCIRTKKYAPMGSALCFPVMSLTHMALLQGILGYDTHDQGSTEIYVYGDDIVLPSTDVDLVFEWLPKFGMKLNFTKSFSESHFRESCGIHAYHGMNVTPLYVKYQPNHHFIKSVISTLSLEEQALNKGWLTLAKFLRRALRTSSNVKFEFVPKDLAIAGYQRDLSYDALRQFKSNRRHIWNKDYQCYTYRIHYYHNAVTECELHDDTEAYLRWLWTHSKNASEVGDSFVTNKVGDSSSKFQLRTKRVLESALTRQTFSASVERAIDRSPIGRFSQDVIVHPVVLRQAQQLQSEGAHTMCVFV